MACAFAPLLALAMVAAVGPAGAATSPVFTPFETVFLRFPVISINRLGTQTATQLASLEQALQAQTQAGAVLEWRVLMQVADQHAAPAAPFDYWVEIWYAGAADYVAHHSSLVPAPIEAQNYLKTTGIGGCKLCPSSPRFADGAPLSAWRHGYFINSQAIGAYPIQATYQAALPLTAAELGTLDYVLTIPLVTITPTQLHFNFTFVTFFEVYESGAAFDTHVLNTNATLEVKGAPNWFTDLGNVRTVWFAFKSHSATGACSRCGKPDTDFWIGSYTNTPAPCSSSTSEHDKGGYVAAVVVLTLLVVGLVIALAVVCRQHGSGSRSASVRAADGTSGARAPGELHSSLLSGAGGGEVYA